MVLRSRLINRHEVQGSRVLFVSSAGDLPEEFGAQLSIRVLLHPNTVLSAFHNASGTGARWKLISFLKGFKYGIGVL